MPVARTDTGTLGVMYLKFCWSRALAVRKGQALSDCGDPALEKCLWNLLRLSPEPVLRHLLLEQPAFAAFEEWIVRTTGSVPAPALVQRFNSLVGGHYRRPPYSAPASDLLTAEEGDFWDKHGYLIVRAAVPRSHCEATLALLCSTLAIDPGDPASWYAPHPLKQGNMVQLFQHPLLERNRQSLRIRHVFEQLWRCNDLLPSADRLGFNPPVTASHPFQGPDLHWDIPLQAPVMFGTQALLYLSDTSADQGAFTLVPGFHRRLDSWLATMPADAHTDTERLHELGSLAIAANAGDLIIWHHALPHGSRPNTAALPRCVQYINYQPLDLGALQQ